MNAIPLQDEDLAWADTLEDDRDLPFSLWIASSKDGDSFLIWDGSFAMLAEQVSHIQHEGARRLLGALLEVSDIFDKR